MTDDEMYEKLTSRLTGAPLAKALAVEIMERINDTSKLHGEIKKLWGTLIVVFIFLFFLLTISGCTHPEVNKCTYICPNNTAPVGCYCLEDEIKREANK